MDKKTRNKKKGFTLIIVIMLIAVMAMAGIALLNLISLDHSLIGQTRRSLHARSISEGGTMEVINNSDFTSIAPAIDAPTLSTIVRPFAGSAFANTISGDDYQARVAFLRIVPLSESSQGLSQAVVYEVVTRSRYGSGEASAELRTEIYRPVNWEGQSIMPRKHYR
jgi:hypothetical protein